MEKEKTPEQILLEADALDKKAEAAVNPEVAAQQEEQAKLDLTPDTALIQARGMVTMICGIVVKKYPATNKVFDAKTKEAGAQVTAPILLKYGISNEFLIKYAAEIGFFLFWAGIGHGCMTAIREDAEAKQQEQKNVEQQPVGAAPDAN